MGNEYHWKVELYRHMGLPALKGLEEILSHSNEKKNLLLKTIIEGQKLLGRLEKIDSSTRV